jgi:hypothetical protein
MDVELEHVPQQIGSAILDVADGKILKVSSKLIYFIIHYILKLF